MQPHAAERRHLERQVTYARPLFAVMALLDLLVVSTTPSARVAVYFVAAYLVLAVLLLLMELNNRLPDWSVPLSADTAALLVFLWVTPSVVSFWFLFLFVAFAAGVRWGLRRMVILVCAFTLALLVRSAIQGPAHWREWLSWMALAAGTFVAGTGFGFIGSRSRRHAAEQEALAQLSGMLRVDQGLAESLRAMLQETAAMFHCEEALLAFRDRELGRIFVWKARQGETERITPQSFPAVAADAYFLDVPEASVGWNALDNGPGDGFGWSRQNALPLDEIPRPPETFRRENGMRSVLSATFEFGGKPDGRLAVSNCARRFYSRDLRWLEHIARHLGPQIENLYLLRHLRARSVESDRNRISHDLHDGILQTMLALDMQLEALRRKVPAAPELAATDLAALQQTLRGETSELRRMVNDLRPLRVDSADLQDLMRSFAERYRVESGIGLEVISESLTVEVSDRVCRELFQIYREALHNIKKHAHASHVMVKLWQDETKVSLVVDDNGQGFSFAGRFTSDELDRLRLGPISIKERTRSMGGMLTVESSPGHGARLIIEVPLT